jgi:octaprenyl-diphosphate synthase
MANNIDSIKHPIAKELDIFEQRFKKSMQGSVPLLNHITNYIYKRKGKQMRPMFVFLVAKLCGEITDMTIRGAIIVEILHTATLVHDDVVDNANERRGFFSINALWKNKIAVLIGDFLLAKGLLLAVKAKDFGLLEIVSNAVQEMSEGELLQVEKARRMDISEELYFDVIRKKTASLIASCCATGAFSVVSSSEIVERMRLFGEKVGIAFQIKDDLFDFGHDDVGKPRGIDIKEKKVTLPLICALNNCSSSEKRHIISLIKNHSENPKKVQQVIEFVNAKGGLQKAEEAMLKYREEAFMILREFPNSDARVALENLVLYTTERKK